MQRLHPSRLLGLHQPAGHIGAEHTLTVVGQVGVESFATLQVNQLSRDSGRADVDGKAQAATCNLSRFYSHNPRRSIEVGHSDRGMPGAFAQGMPQAAQSRQSEPGRLASQPRRPGIVPRAPGHWRCP